MKRTARFTIPRYRAKAVVRALESDGLAPAEIARRTGIARMTVEAWVNDIRRLRELDEARWLGGEEDPEERAAREAGPVREYGLSEAERELVRRGWRIVKGWGDAPQLLPPSVLIGEEAGAV